MRQVSWLFVLAGFAGDLDRLISSLQSRYTNERYDFRGRSYPDRPEKRAKYLEQIGRIIVEYIFGEGNATSFCRSFDQPCASDPGNARPRVCRHQNGEFACYRARPRLLVVIAHPRVREEVFDRLGRAVLLISHGYDGALGVDAVAETIRNQEHHLRSVQEFLENRRQNVLAPLVPLRNYQVKSNVPIARDAQANLGSFPQVMLEYHQRLYDPQFQNARKRYMRGAYRFPNDIGFQRDPMHNFGYVGPQSRTNIFHLINAHYLYGVSVPPGFHFDVSAIANRPLHQVFEDVLNGDRSNPAATHVNITPCDRLV